MHLFLKAASRTVHHYHEPEEEEEKNSNYTSNLQLTVWTKSLILSCKGFTVIGSDGNLVYRVDNYTSHPHQIILMDASGNPIFTICRPKQKIRIVDKYWLVYEGEVGNNSINSSKKPIFCVRKNISIMKKTKPRVLAYVYGEISEKNYTYMIGGSYEHRSCKIYDESRRVVSEIKKKEGLIGGVSFGLEVFHLIVRPGIKSRFAMAIVLSLDQMFS